MKLFLSVFTFLICLSGCSKMEDKKISEENKMSSKNDPAVVPQDKTQTENNSGGQSDEKASEFVKVANDAIEKYSQEKSDINKKEVVATCVSAGNYLMFEANLPAREKYRPALKYYRKALELDPTNIEAMKNKKQIEDIYEQMGMPIPQ
ncbi:MAG: tetratricopeptide repeat protein [Ignavibacteria bacterium]